MLNSPIENKALLIVVSAPSGTGKTTLCDSICLSMSTACRAVTCTTRAPRADESDGEDYYFLNEHEFLARVQGGEFLENAFVHGSHYGVLKSEVRAKLAEGKDVLLNIDVQGAAAIRERAEDDLVLRLALVTVFLCPPSLDELERRLRGRGDSSEVDIIRRLAIAKAEIAQKDLFDYLIISGTRQADLEAMQKIIQAVRIDRNK
ncbi:MAG: guanylate kinase [Verrucomicrobiota bacterium]|nr:guanylate kinase [Verrucomicrobiota bacterium]